MNTVQTNSLKHLLPLIIAIMIIALILILSLMFNLHQYPIWIKEDGVIESLSVFGYFTAAVFMIVKGGWEYIKKYYYFLILIIFFGLRELDFHKKFTTMGIFKSKFYLSSQVPFLEKLIGFLVIIFIVSIVLTIIKKHSKDFFTKLKSFSSIHVGIFFILFFLFFTKTIDGLSRKLEYVNIVIDEQVSTYIEIMEEIFEMGIPLLIIATLVIYFENEDSKSLNSATSHT